MPPTPPWKESIIRAAGPGPSSTVSQNIYPLPYGPRFLPEIPRHFGISISPPNIPMNRGVPPLTNTLPRDILVPMSEIFIAPDLQIQVSTSEVMDVAPPPVAIEDGKVVYPPLSLEEETFALAMVEMSGNVGASYKAAYGVDVNFPSARGKELLAKPAIALKIRSITEAVEDASLISVGAHLSELSDIRDLAKVTGQLKTALAAERSRGEAVGIYQRHEKKNSTPNAGGVNIMINMASKHDVDI